MKNPYEVLRAKELELIQLKIEVSSLRVAVPLLVEESDIKASSEESKSKMEFP